jgi:hypothetical protein
MSFVPQGAKFSVRAVVKLADQAGAPVNGATVTGNFNGSFNNASRTGVTASDGYATIMSSSTIKNGTITFTVVKITAGSLIYNPDANVVTSATISR